jgi:hypothetical protein
MNQELQRRQLSGTSQGGFCFYSQTKQQYLWYEPPAFEEVKKFDAVPDSIDLVETNRVAEIAPEIS